MRLLDEVVRAERVKLPTVLPCDSAGLLCVCGGERTREECCGWRDG